MKTILFIILRIMCILLFIIYGVSLIYIVFYKPADDAAARIKEEELKAILAYEEQNKPRGPDWRFDWFLLDRFVTYRLFETGLSKDKWFECFCLIFILKELDLTRYNVIPASRRLRYRYKNSGDFHVFLDNKYQYSIHSVSFVNRSKLKNVYAFTWMLKKYTDRSNLIYVGYDNTMETTPSHILPDHIKFINYDLTRYIDAVEQKHLEEILIWYKHVNFDNDGYAKLTECMFEILKKKK